MTDLKCVCGQDLGHVGWPLCVDWPGAVHYRPDTDVDSLRAEVERLQEALSACRHAFSTINVSNGATRAAMKAIADATDGIKRAARDD